jgi:sarcosine oxidase/L-pipecolate oxidase
MTLIKLLKNVCSQAIKICHWKLSLYVADDLPSPNQDDRSYTWSVVESIAADVWRNDPIYRPEYHETGFIYAAVSDEAYRKVVKACEEHHEYMPLRNAQDFRETMPKGVLTGKLPGWRGFLRNKRAGWVAARSTIISVHDAAEKMGVRFITGKGGAVTKLLLNDEGTEVIGAVTADDLEHRACHIILAAGASSDRLLDFKKQLRPTAWTLAHIELTEEEARLYRDLPVLYGVDRGFFIEPNAGARELKICDEHPGYLNFIYDDLRNEKRSVPFAKNQIPLESEQRIRNLLKETMPNLAERQFSFARVCWDADTVDRLFLIGQHPQYKGLTLAVGGSGHGFMCSPAVGVLVADSLEGKMDTRLVKTLGWREEQAVNRNWWDTQGRFGVETKVMDFQDVKEWTNIAPTDTLVDTAAAP